MLEDNQVPTPMYNSCPVCGGNLIGNGYNSPLRCEFAEVPDYVECDSGPWYCEEIVD
jgi:hypothetical protein